MNKFDLIYRCKFLFLCLGTKIFTSQKYYPTMMGYSFWELNTISNWWLLSLFARFFRTVPRASIMIGVTFMIQFFQLFGKVQVFFHSDPLTPSLFLLWSIAIAKSTSWQVLFFSIKTRSCLLAWIGWSILISKSQRILCISFCVDRFWFVFSSI